MKLGTKVGFNDGADDGDLLGFKVGENDGATVPADSTVTAEKTFESAKINAVCIAFVTEGADTMLNIVLLDQTDLILAVTDTECKVPAMTSTALKVISEFEIVIPWL